MRKSGEQSYWKSNELIDEIIDFIIKSGNEDSSNNSDKSEPNLDTEVSNGSAV